MHKTSLESYVEDLYQLIGITEPSQLDLFAIGEHLGLKVYSSIPATSKVVRIRGKVALSIDSRLTLAEQWQDFGHELFHVLKDTGNQLKLPPDMIEYRELHAENFALEFCITTFRILHTNVHAE